MGDLLRELLPLKVELGKILFLKESLLNIVCS
jgi:hypothetical protein